MVETDPATNAGPDTGNLEGILRTVGPQVLGILARRHRRFDEAEDAVQEALLAAATQWPGQGVPDSPRAWLLAVGTRRLIDQRRAAVARERRESRVTIGVGLDEPVTWLPQDLGEPETDDSLTLLFMCAHPALSPASQLALTLRAAGGLTTAEIARAFFVPEATMAQRISRAKQTIRTAGGRFELPAPSQRPERLQIVLHVLYLIFNEGYTATTGLELQRVELTAEAIRLARDLHRLRANDGEVTGLLALMLLTDARRAARTNADGDLVPLAEQDRTLWNRSKVDEGVRLLQSAMKNQALGPYQLQAAIAAIHDEAPDAAATDWPEILALYRLLGRFVPNPMVWLNEAVATAMVLGPAAGLAMLEQATRDGRLDANHRADGVRGHLLDMLGDADGAAIAYRRAARMTTSSAERRYLERKAAALSRSGPQPSP